MSQTRSNNHQRRLVPASGAMTRDIDRIIEIVRSRIPDVEVVQMHKTHPADDDGLWWFRLPGVRKDFR